MPCRGREFLPLLGNNHNVMDRTRQAESGRLKAYVAWILEATRDYGIKGVNPGGVETIDIGGTKIAALDDVVPGFEVTPRHV